jgi:hypothetical protein
VIDAMAQMMLGGRRKRRAWGAALLVAALARPGAGQQPADIRSLIGTGNLQDMRWPNFSDYRPWLQKFYEPTEYAPSWVKGTQPAPQALSLIGLFRNAGEKGLNPEDDVPVGEERIRAATASSGAAPHARRGTHRLRHTIRVRPAHRTNQPTAFEFGLNVEQKKYDLARFLRPNPGRFRYSVSPGGGQPPFEAIGGRSGPSRTISSSCESTMGKSSRDLAIDRASPAGVPRLVRFLRRVGDLPADAALPADSQTYTGRSSVRLLLPHQI